MNAEHQGIKGAKAGEELRESMLSQAEHTALMIIAYGRKRLIMPQWWFMLLAYKVDSGIRKVNQWAK